MANKNSNTPNPGQRPQGQRTGKRSEASDPKLANVISREYRAQDQITKRPRKRKPSIKQY